MADGASGGAEGGAGHGGRSRELQWAELVEMTQTRSASTDQLSLPQLTHVLESRIPVLAERTAARISAEIPEYAGTAEGRRYRRLRAAIGEAASLFLRKMSGRGHNPASVQELFRSIGQRQARDGKSLRGVSTAIGIGSREAWAEMREVCTEFELTAAVLGRLTDDLMEMTAYLQEQVRIGHGMESRAQSAHGQAQRSRLFVELMSDPAQADLESRCAQVGWPLPRRMVTVSTRLEPGAAWPPPGIDDDVLAGPDAEIGLLLVAEEDLEPLLKYLRAWDGANDVARSWAVTLDDLAASRRWVERALDLVEAGVIPRQPVIDCTRYRTQLWLHSEPELRRQLAQELLSPLISETPNSREILSDTLLVWLETRESAPAIAAVLGVHPQTVRYRWRRINELFGDALHDPEFVVQLTMVLKASLPMWKAGDQSDFERYRAGEQQ